MKTVSTDGDERPITAREKLGVFGSWYFWFFLIGVASACLFVLFLNHDIFKSLFSIGKALDNAEMLRARILEQGKLAPFLFVALQVLQILVAPLPGEATGLLGGYLFGVWPGFVLSTIGLALGSWIAFAAGHFFGDLIGDRLKRTRAYKEFNTLAVKSDFIIPFILFLVPGFPKDILSYLLGLSRMPAPVFMFISAVGRIPGTILLTMQGAQVYERNFTHLVILALLTAAIGLPCYFFRGRMLSRYRRQLDGAGKESDPRG